MAVESHFSRGHISFPFALLPSTRPGELSNLIGFGYITNNSNPVPALWDLAIWIALSLGLYRLFKGGAIIGLAGGLANLYELVTRGAVLDWIIVPKGGNRIDGISLGDLLVFIGWAWMLLISFGLLVKFGKVLRDAWQRRALHQILVNPGVDVLGRAFAGEEIGPPELAIVGRARRGHVESEGEHRLPSPASALQGAGPCGILPGAGSHHLSRAASILSRLAM